ncbi:MAG: helix-turn-helix transcriptional regulator [Ruminococcaceae bacterium]|nr:helix-turn-helix transcriptional regulator [Oscillospiraceae bacterium]
MTKHEAYMYGWVFGRLEMALESVRTYDQTGFKMEQAAKRPMTGNALILAAAAREHLLRGELDRQIASALNEISADDLPVEVEPVVSAELQGSWMLGRYQGVTGKIKSSYDIASKRKEKGMSQAELARQLGTTQAAVSRWENGTVQPSEESLGKIREILG